MKWFFGLVVLLNLFVALWGNLSHHAPGDLHAMEVNGQGVKLLPGGWTTQPAAASAPAAEASLPVAEVKPATTSELPATLDGAKPLTLAPTASATKVLPPPAEPAKPADKPTDKPAAAKTPEPAKAEKTAAVCRQWGELSDAQLARVKEGLAPLKLSVAETARETAPATGKFWVYLPRRANAEATRALSADLKLKGFDNYPVNTDGEHQGALSLGLFSKEEGADALVAKLKAAGFAEARAERRGKAVTATTLRFAALSPEADAKLAALQARLFPGVPLKACR